MAPYTAATKLTAATPEFLQGIDTAALMQRVTAARTAIRPSTELASAARTAGSTAQKAPAAATATAGKVTTDQLSTALSAIKSNGITTDTKLLVDAANKPIPGLEKGMQETLDKVLSIQIDVMKKQGIATAPASQVSKALKESFERVAASAGKLSKSQMAALKQKVSGAWYKTLLTGAWNNKGTIAMVGLNLGLITLMILPFFGISSFVGGDDAAGGGGEQEGGGGTMDDAYAMLCDTVGEPLCKVVPWITSVSSWGCCCCCILIICLLVVGGGSSKKAVNVNF